MLRIRRSDDRGQANHGWLRSQHTFSFAGYYDPEQMGFRALRVINEDQVDPGHGFPTHGHRDMEIISYVLEGGLEHKDSMGSSGVLRPGEVQRMSAGTGVLHSEFNASKIEDVHFLQIWILPERRGTAPSYEQKYFDEEERSNRLRLLVAPDGAEGALRIQQDLRLYGTLLEAGREVTHTLAEGRHAWVQVARGEITLQGERLRAGDGAAVSDLTELTLVGVEPAEVLLFDLA